MPRTKPGAAEGQVGDIQVSKGGAIREGQGGVRKAQT